MSAIGQSLGLARLRPYGGLRGLIGFAVVGAVLLASGATAFAKEQRAFYLTGEKSAEVAKQPRFQGEIYPTYLATQGNTTVEFGFQAGTLKCPGSFSGQLAAAGPAVGLTSFYEYFACQTPGSLPLSITANGCENTLTVLNQGPPYVGQWGYKCPPGVSYEFRMASALGVKCTIAIPSQTGLSEVKLENTGEGKSRSVKAILNVSKLKYVQKEGSAFFCNPGEYENGTIAATMTLNGFDKQF
jgi:hypothetical protein